MTLRETIAATTRRGRLGLLLLALAASALTPLAARAENCSDYPNGTLDGFAGTLAPSQLKIDRNCTIRNYPASNPFGTNISFLTQPGQTDARWIVIFDNVVHTGEMACNAVAGHKIWFVNGSSSSIQQGCQNLLIPVEKIVKQNPAGQTTAAIGVPFTYSLTIPVLFDPATGTVIDSAGSPNDLHSVTIWDDLDATGVDLTYLSHVAYWKGSGAPVTHTFSNVGGLLTFDVAPVIPAGDQIVIEITVVLEDTPANAPGTAFVNTAKWDFGRLIDGVFYEPLPGEWGISPPLTIAAPQLVVTKTGPATLGRTLNLGELGRFTVEALNSGTSDAWDVTLLDRLPDGPTGGMCDLTPELLSVTLAGNPLGEGTDYSLAYRGAPTCELTLTLLDAAGPIGPGERLVVEYQTKLDADSQEGAALTNVAGATRWFNDASTNPDRQAYVRTLTDGTPGVLDHEDAHTVVVALAGFFFEKTVADLTTGVDPTATAAPGDRLRYTLRLQATDVPLDGLTFYDDLGRLNPTPVFVPGSLALVSSSLPANADATRTDPSGGTNGAGILDVRNLSVPANGEIRIQFDVTLDPTLLDGTIVLDQAALLSTIKIADSDDPTINGQADPAVEGDEDPTAVRIGVTPPTALQKANTQATAAIGEEFTYRITVPSTPHIAPLYDVRILDDLTNSAADLQFVAVRKISESGAWTPVNTGTDTNLVIEDPVNGIDIAAGEQIVLEITVRLLDTTTNVAGMEFTNSASYTYDLVDGDPASARPGDPGSTEPMTIVEPALTLEKSGPAQMTLGVPATFTLDVHDPSGARAWNPTLEDRLPSTAAGGTCDAAPTRVTAQVFQADGTTAVSGPLVEGTDFTTSMSAAPDCLFRISLLSAAASIGPDQRLIVTYQTLLDADTQDGAVLTNVAGVTRWFSAESADPQGTDGRRAYTRTLTDGTVGVLDHEDAHTVGVALPAYLFEKTVIDLTTGADPATRAAPGDRLRYRLRVENLGDTPLADFRLFDELDRLNDPAVFQPGTLALVTVPGGADTSNTSSTGGARGTGVLDIRGLALPGRNDSLLVEFEIELAPVIANGTLATNQSALLVGDAPFARSDDPNVNGAADPFVAGDEDPTRVLIDSAAVFRVEKVSSDLTGDPGILLAGETLRYTITVRNVGSADAIDVVLRDQIPANTTYVAGSTTLDGDPVADGAGGGSPLGQGIAIHAPADPTPGTLRADPSEASGNVATIVFDVVVDPGAADGTVISNQAFVSAPAGGVSDQPSDDPRTSLPDDPTRDVVGNAPLLFVAKDVALGVDRGTPGIVDPGDVLHYTITLYNTGSVAATGVALRDDVPADTTYVADSLAENGLPVGQPDGGVSPLVAGIPVSSSDLTPPLPGPGAGTLTPGQSARVEFDLRVDDGVEAGTLISNQAATTSAELPTVLSDGDGNPATGPEPTVVVVGSGQQLAILKQVAVVGGGAAVAGSELEYVVIVTNVAAVPAFDVVISDDLDAATPGVLSFVAASATLDGSTTGVDLLGSILTADYSATRGPLQPGDSIVLRFRAQIAANLPIGTTIANTAVVAWNTPVQTASSTVALDLGGVPGAGVLNGTVWHDADFDDAVGATERSLQGWLVELYRNGQLLQSTPTAADGTYRITGVAPNDTTGDRYELRFRAPDAGASSAALGTAHSAFTNGPQRISDIVVTSGGNLQGLDLPIDPDGVVYGALERTPISGATLTLLGAGSGMPLPSSCFDDPVQQGQVTRGDGYYKFDLNFSDPSCPSGGSYLIAVTPPGSQYAAGPSQMIPPTSDASTPPFSVPACPGSSADAIPATSQYCEAQPSELAPPPTVGANSAGTRYYVHLTLDGTRIPGSSQIFNNHIPLDPSLDGVVPITKTTPATDVTRGQLVPYEITVGNQLAVELVDVAIVDTLPAGFRYVEGSARLDGVSVEPTDQGGQLVWTGIAVPSSGRLSLRLLLAVGAGVSEGKYVNRAQVVSATTGRALSGEATATVRVAPDPTFDCTDAIGKVFDDANGNGLQDAGEKGLPGVRLVTTRGLVATTDPQGRFHITCALTPNELRGSNFVLKLDDRTLPSGYRMTTRQVQVQRATAGKALRLHFGASITRVVGLDLADAVFVPGSVAMRTQWEPRISLLLEQLRKAPAILRLSYVADLEDEALVERRLEAIKAEIARAWDALDARPLTIETEIFWRRGEPVAPSGRRAPDPGSDEPALPPVGAGPPVIDAPIGEAVERHLSTDEPLIPWTQDPERLATDLGDRIEQREIVSDQARTVKLKDVVPPIHFESGVAKIPPSTIAKLRSVLDGMRHLRNVRLHLVGHADSQPLSGALSGVYGDNEGLSRERAGEVAEFLQTALGLPPESISFSWAGDTQPVATNATAEGRARNRRVEVEVWYDEIDERPALEDVVVPQEIKRVKVCRMETVCKLRYREGHAHRARVRNLVAPLHFSGESVDVPEAFVRQIGDGLHNLRDRQNVQVQLIGFSDDVPLTGRAERIYGTPLALSKAMAHRAALAVQEALHLPSAAVASDGRGTAQPLASNDTDRGRALNRRIEVEFWYDDPLQELPDEPQLCPDAAGADVVTKVYDPPWGPLQALPIEDGAPRIPPGYADDLRRALSEVADKTHVRLRFVGYTGNERLERRTAIVYGDDVGLATARARRAMESLQAELGLADSQVEHEGRGYVHADDVVNAGFLQDERSYVAVQVVYDELAVLDDYDGVEVTRITRELHPKDPLALNLMRITVDGEPIDDPGRSSADIQRCTDVALERADIQFQFDDLESTPRLSVTAVPASVPVDATGTAGPPPPPVRFRMYTNYGHFIERSEVRIFDRERSLQSEPLAVVEVGEDGLAQWQAPAESFAGPVRELRYVLRAYDGKGHFDETTPQTLWLVHASPGDPRRAAARAGAESEGTSAEPAGPPRPDPLLEGYGENGASTRNIPLGRVGTVRVHGRSIPPDHGVWVAGSPVPVNESGEFVAEALLPTGAHTVEVAVLDPSGSGELFLRDLELERNDWFYVGMADLTLSANRNSGPVGAAAGKQTSRELDSLADGRLAFFLTGRFAEDWRLTASADTREEPMQDLFSNFLDKSPDSLFRRIDPDYHYPTFGDDGTVDEAAPTMGKFFAKLEHDDSHAMWGNFAVRYLENELAHVDRGLYGANLHYQSAPTTRFGEKRLVLDGFAAEPGTVPSREEFRGTGGSLYYLRRQDLLVGSERVRIEVRDRDSGLVKGVVPLRPTVDYDIDYLQGRILLTEPVSATVEDGQLVRSSGLSGDEAWLVVQYEYTPGFDQIDALAAGGQGHYWLGDYVKLGLTANRNQEGDSDSSLYGADLTFRRTADSWLKLQVGRSEGLVSNSLRSDDGGFRFLGSALPADTRADANAYRADLSVGVADFLEGRQGRLAFYLQSLDGGYSAPGMNALTDTEQYGGTLAMPVTDRLQLTAKADRSVQRDGLETTAEEVDVGYRLTERWSMSAGVRNDERKDDSPIVPVTQKEGERTDAVVQVAYDSRARWRSYGFAQQTLHKTGDRPDNGRYGLGGAYRISDRVLLEGEVSHGDLGPGVKLGTTYQQSEGTRRYLSYSLDNERGDDGLYGRRGTLISGVRTRLADGTSLYVEDRYQHTDQTNGLARTMGMSFAPTDRWTVSGNWEIGTLIDRQTQAETDRRAGGARLGYAFDDLQFSSGVEYRYDDTEQPDGTWSERTTWLFRNSLRYQINPDGRLLGKFNHSFSDSSLGQFYDGGYTEAVLGYAYRPVAHDRLHALAKYTYFYNVPTPEQVLVPSSPLQVIQKSHVLALDLTYDLTESFSIGTKYAYRLGQVSLDRESPSFFDNDAHLSILRGDWRFGKNWEGSVEGRMLALPDLDQRRGGALLTLYRYLGAHFKVGVGYNFTDFSDDLTDLRYDHHGVFFNLVGSM